MRLNLYKLKLLARSAIIVTLIVVLCFIIFPIAWSLNGVMGLCAAALSAVICLISVLVALFLNNLFSSPKQAFMGILLGMAIGTGIPLMLGAAIHLYGGPLSQAGFIYYLLIFYLPTLAIKTILTLPNTNKQVVDNGG
jgi:hypothetical protein